MDQVSSDDFAEWKLHPITQAFFASLGRWRGTLMDDWASGTYTAEHADATAQKNAEAIGAVRTIQEIIETTVEDING
jgi:hypothetical protein